MEMTGKDFAEALASKVMAIAEFQGASGIRIDVHPTENGIRFTMEGPTDSEDLKRKNVVRSRCDLVIENVVDILEDGSEKGRNLYTENVPLDTANEVLGYFDASVEAYSEIGSADSETITE